MGAQTHSRRAVLGSAAAAVVGVAAAACRIDTSRTGPQTNVGGGSIAIPDSDAVLPTGDVTIRWLSGGPGGKSYFFRPLFPAYEKKHPNVTIEYDELPNDKIAEVLPLQLRNGQVDDVFQVIGIPVSELVESGKVAVLDDLIPNFEEWKETLPFSVLIPGSHTFEGKTYAIPTGSNKRTGQLLLFNTEYIERAEIDPTTDDFDWDDLRSAAKKVNEQGDGEYFGFITGSNPPGPIGGMVNGLAQLAGSVAGDDGIDWSTGEYRYHDDEHVAALELLLAIKDDGSLYPGALALTDQEARARMALGASGFILQGAWNFPVWRDQNPDFAYGVAKPPRPEAGMQTTLRYPVGGGNSYSVFAESSDEQKAVAGDLLGFIGTPEGQRAWASLVGSADPAWSQDAIRKVLDSDALAKNDRLAFQIYAELMRLAPSPVIRNPDAAAISLVIKPVIPDIGTITQGVLAGEVKDISKALTKLSDDSNQALDEAIDAARKQGAEISREDWVFPNWDPNRDYTIDDYDELGG